VSDCEGPDEITLDGFTWDENKNYANYEKHKVDFDEAITCFALGRDKRFTISCVRGEARWVLQGTSDFGRPLTVIFVLLEEQGCTVARIISARRR
jgi:uncharacterized DUF497 family protein